MTEDELNGVREFVGDLLIRAFRGEVDLASALTEVRDLELTDVEGEEPELPDDLVEEGAEGVEEAPPTAPEAELSATADELEAALAAATSAAL